MGAYNGQSAFLFSGGELTPINPPGATKAEARSINKNRVIVGDCLVEGKHKGFKYDGIVTFIIYPGAEETRTFGINDGGTIVGKFRNTDSTVWVGFILKNGQYQPIQFPNALDTRPNGINNSELIVGYYSYDNNISHGFIYRGGQFTTVDFPGAEITEIVHVNNYGKIVGWYDDYGFLASPPSTPPLSLLLY